MLRQAMKFESSRLVANNKSQLSVVQNKLNVESELRRPSEGELIDN